MERKQAKDFDQKLLDLYDDYAHGRVNRRDFVRGVGAFAVGGMTVEGLIQAISPNYAWAEQVKKDDPAIKTETVQYKSPKGAGEMQGYMAWPAKASGKLPAVLVVHENRGLNPYVQDVVRRLGKAGFLAFGPDALYPLGGYPGNDDEGREMQRKRDSDEMIQDFIAAAKLLDIHKMSNGHVGVVGFCYGGGICNTLAVEIPDVIDAAAPYYGRQPDPADVSKIKAALLIHYAALDERINAGWPAYEEALKQNDVEYEAFIYQDCNHGFHNDTTPRFDEEAAELSWKRTIDFFKKELA
ncbi:dienelactone hydrolase family protein [Rubinisphaera italica]|uniref:Carboxymethylenebutenolidase n=1 Tax=Rubinisphaera italica TaxID=2527969 RepID=A0A5C5XKQ6_9PLAN|nr:dienelactone hydrolase family protein [Rubinisphaera italica]TWT63288.1 Carboxymethylenebutenolidase [Rubinisphaera italica]